MRALNPLVSWLVPWIAVLLATAAACSPDATSGFDIADAGWDARDTILVPVADVPDVPDVASTDTIPVDTSTSDTSTSDTSTTHEDTSTSTSDTSTTHEDTSTSTDAAPDVDADPYAPGTLAYDRVANIIAVDDLTRVRFHPSGDFALVLGHPNKILYYDAEARALTSLGTIGSTLRDLDVAPEGTFVIVGQDGATSRLWTAAFDDEGTLVTTPTDIPTGSAQIVTVEPLAFRSDPKNPTRFVIGAAGSTDNIAYAYLFEVVAGLSPVRGFNTSAGLYDLMWGDPQLHGGSSAVVTSEGVNNAGSHTWVLASDLIVGNGWSAGFGNGGRAHWRPGGGYGIVTGWSSNKLYVYDGAWELATLPVPTGASPNAVRWRDHRRALVVGRVIATPPYAVVIDVRAGDAEAWPATFVDQSIRDFDEAPWFGNTSSMHLLDVDWRPGVDCDEGLIVGTDSGTSFSPTFGTAIHFQDSADAACP